MFSIVYLNENLRYCNENLAWGKQEPLIHPYMLCYATEGEKAPKTSFYFFTCRYHNFKDIPNNILIEYQHTTPVEYC